MRAVVGVLVAVAACGRFGVDGHSSPAADALMDDGRANDARATCAQ